MGVEHDSDEGTLMGDKLALEDELDKRVSLKAEEVAEVSLWLL